MKISEVLNLQIEECDAFERGTIKDYFHELLRNLWIEEESFSGKRPFGNSGWQHDITKTLINYNVIPGKLDEYGFVDSIEISDEKVQEYILELIAECFK